MKIFSGDRLGYLIFGILMGACGFGVGSYAGIYVAVLVTMIACALWNRFTPKLFPNYYLGKPFGSPEDLTFFWIGALLLALFMLVI